MNFPFFAFIAIIFKSKISLEDDFMIIVLLFDLIFKHERQPDIISLFSSVLQINSDLDEGV